MMKAVTCIVGILILFFHQFHQQLSDIFMLAIVLSIGWLLGEDKEVQE
jgi:hypothetical protein